MQNFIICTPEPIFFNAIFSGEESHTGEWVANKLIQQMEDIGVHKFSAIITDTASVMKAAWKQIEEKYSNIVCLGCNSHIINLLIGDILKIKEIKDIVDNSKIIVNYFKSHVQAAAKLKRIQIENYNKEIALVLPVLTRWGTHLSCFQSLQKSKIALEQILMDAEIRRKMDSTVRNYVLSEQFWEMLDLITKFLEPMVVALKLFESDTSTLSTVYLHFKKIMNQVSEISCDFSNNIQQLVQKRWEYLYHPIMMAAYMLDPRFLEESRNTDIEATGYTEFTVFTSKKFGQEESVNLFIELVKFRQKVHHTITKQFGYHLLTLIHLYGGNLGQTVSFSSLLLKFFQYQRHLQLLKEIFLHLDLFIIKSVIDYKMSVLKNWFIFMEIFGYTKRG